MHRALREEQPRADASSSNCKCWQTRTVVLGAGRMLCASCGKRQVLAARLASANPDRNGSSCNDLAWREEQLQEE